MGVAEFIAVTDNVMSREDVKIILDVGSLHAQEAREFSAAFPNAKIYSFECNHDSYLRCVEATKDFPRCNVVNKAVHNYDGVCRFYPIDTINTVTTHADGNPGASSLFKAAGTYDHIEKYVQHEVEVPCTRLDTWAKENSIEEIDLLWMDLQGGELLALEGLGDLLQKVKVIHTEVELNPMYTGQVLFPEVEKFMVENGFKRVWGNLHVQFGTDVIYIRNEEIERIVGVTLR